MRSGLTLLGIVIGITAVSVLMSIGRGVQDSITSSLQSQGTNLLFVRPGASETPPESGASTLTLQDAEALLDAELAPSVKAVAPQIDTWTQVVAGREHVSAQVIGVVPEHAAVNNLRMTNGGFLTQSHIANRSEVAVVSTSVSRALFGARSPVGESIRVNGRQFAVVGLVEDSGAGFFGSGEQVFVPITTAYYRLSSERTAQGAIGVTSINVQAISQEAIGSARLEIASILRQRHRVTERNDFKIDTLQELVETLNQVVTAFVLFLGFIGGISLLVGGIGVMNIMLVSVTERTREVGIRKAMGAKRRDILMQFITEAIFLTVAGGIIGMLISLALSPIINLAVGLLNVSDSGLGGFTFHPDVALMALSVSAAVGLLSGIYPAMRAARMHPIDALRYE